MDEAGRELQEALRGLLVALVKAALVGEDAPTESWRREGEARQRLLHERLGAGEARPKLDAAWDQALKQAKADETVGRLENVNPSLPSTSPLSLDDLAAAGFRFDAAAERIRVSSSTG